MDVIRPVSEVKSRRRRRIIVWSAAVLAVVAGLYATMRMSSGAPAFDRAGLWVDTVKRGTLVRDIRGVGVLVTDDDASLWMAAEMDGRVDRKLLEEGATVSAETVILKMSNPDVEQAAVAADLALQAAEAAYRGLEASLNNELLAQRSATAAIEADRVQAAMQAEVDQALAKDGLLADVTARLSTVKSDALGTRARIEQDRLETTERSLDTRLAVQRSEVANRRTLAALRHRDLETLTVRAGMAGILQNIVVEVGQRVQRSANLARVVDPARLKGELRIPEAQTSDLRTGLRVSIDTHSGVIPGRVSRIAPAAENGTVTIDVALEGELPRGARPDMTVDGLIEIERLEDVLHVGRPASTQLEGTTTLFRVSPDGMRAERVPVRLGRVSASDVEITGGDLRAGDRVVLSDTSVWGGHSAVQLRP